MCIRDSLHTGLADLALTLGDDEQERLKTSCCVLDGADAQLLAWIRDLSLIHILRVPRSVVVARVPRASPWRNPA